MDNHQYATKVYQIIYEEVSQRFHERYDGHIMVTSSVHVGQRSWFLSVGGTHACAQLCFYPSLKKMWKYIPQRRGPCVIYW